MRCEFKNPTKRFEQLKEYEINRFRFRNLINKMKMLQQEYWHNFMHDN